MNEYVNAYVTELSFNLNLLECKSQSKTVGSIIEKVLISTYWNVNADSLYANMIDIIRFNLNLLECKSEMQTSAVQTSAVLISTYWNVNFKIK